MASITRTNDRQHSMLEVTDVLRFAFDWAFEKYHERGFSVIPMQGKRPALRSWKEFQGRRPTLEELKGWFAQRPVKQHNLGVVTGAVSDIVVMDFDSLTLGRDWLEQHPTPLVVQTGNGGMHLYYRHPGYAVTNRVRVGAQAHDVRADGGVCVLPPSIHPITGKAYQWVTPIHEISLDEVPLFDSSWLPRSPKVTPVPWQEINPKKSLRRVRAYIRKIQSIEGHGGSNACYRAAAHLREAGLSPDEVFRELMAWNEEGCAQPPWTEAELRHKVQSVFRDYT